MANSVDRTAMWQSPTGIQPLPWLDFSFLEDEDFSVKLDYPYSASTLEGGRPLVGKTQLQSPQEDSGAKSFRAKSRSIFRRIFSTGKPVQDLTLPIERWRKVLVTFGCVMASLMIGLDQSIMQPALPTIAIEFNSLNAIGSYSSAYILPQCVLHPLYSKLYAMSSFSHVYLGSLLFFATGSLVAATSTSSNALIVGRTLCGIGAAGANIGAYRLTALVPESKGQIITVGLFSVVLGGSVVLGPILGGIFTSNLNWHWIFWINLPVVGVVLITLAAAALFGGPDLRGEDYHKTRSQKLKTLDWLGYSLMVLSILPILLAFQFSQESSWKSARVIVLLVVSGISFVALVVQQYYTPHERIFELSIMSKRSVWPTCGLFFSSMMALGAIMLFLPFELELVKGFSAKDAGFRLIPVAGGIVAGTISCSILATIVPYFNPIAIGAGIGFLTASALFLTLGVNFSLSCLYGYEILAGFSLGISLIAEMIFPRASLGKHDLAKCWSYTRMAQMLGAALSVQVATVIFTSRLEVDLKNQNVDLSSVDLAGILGNATTGTGFSIAGPESSNIIFSLSQSLRSGLILGTVSAALALIFTIVLPWTKLKNGVTDRGIPSG